MVKINYKFKQALKIILKILVKNFGRMKNLCIFVAFHFYFLLDLFQTARPKAIAVFCFLPLKISVQQ